MNERMNERMCAHGCIPTLSGALGRQEASQKRIRQGDKCFLGSKPDQFLRAVDSMTWIIRIWIPPCVLGGCPWGQVPIRLCLRRWDRQEDRQQRIRQLGDPLNTAFDNPVRAPGSELSQQAPTSCDRPLPRTLGPCDRLDPQREVHTHRGLDNRLRHVALCKWHRRSSEVARGLAMLHTIRPFLVRRLMSVGSTFGAQRD